jgi:hypothetical protein
MSFFVAGASVAASPRFGGSETDVFSVGATGQIGVSWVAAAGAWNQPLPLTPINMFLPGGHLAASQQFGTAAPQTDVFAVDMQGALNVLYAGKPGSSYRRLKLTAANTYLAGVSMAVAGQRVAGAIPRPGPLNQTDVFVIGADGGLNVHSAIGDGSWEFAPVGPRNLAPPGTPLAAGTRTSPEGIFEAYETYAFFVDGNGALNAYSVDHTGVWQHQLISDPGTFPPGTYIAVSEQFGTGNGNAGNQLDVFAIDDHGTLNVFYTSGAGWANQKIRSNIALTPGAPLVASQQFITGVNQTNLMTFDPVGVLNIFYVDGAGVWNWIELAPENAVPARCPLACSRQIGSPNNDSMQLDVFFVDSTNGLNISWVVEGYAWQEAVLADQATLPLKGIGSNANIELHNNCGDITGLQVSILITEDIEANNGIAFQLNCASGLGSSITFQQYLFTSPPGSQPPAIKWGVNNYAPLNTSVINDGAVLLTLPTAPGVLIPAGYKFLIQLLPYAANLVISSTIGGAVYTVFDPTGKQVREFVLALENETSHTTNQKITVAEMAPIIGFQLDIVGWMNSAATTLTSGAGIITYSVLLNETLQPLEETLPCLNSSTITITGETSNVSYQTMAVGKTRSFTQAFQAIAKN